MWGSEPLQAHALSLVGRLQHSSPIMCKPMASLVPVQAPRCSSRNTCVHGNYNSVSLNISFNPCTLRQVCTCNMCGCGAIMDSVFAMMAAAWWVVGALVISSNATRANNAGLQKPEWRSALAWLTWVNAMLFGAMFAVHVIRVVGKYCNCCRRRRGPEEDAEKAMLSNHGRSVAALELGNEVKSRHYMQHQSPHLQQQFMADGRNI